jgi:hypothetical protein
MSNLLHCSTEGNTMTENERTAQAQRSAEYFARIEFELALDMSRMTGENVFTTLNAIHEATRNGATV